MNNRKKEFQAKSNTPTFNNPINLSYQSLAESVNMVREIFTKFPPTTIKQIGSQSFLNIATDSTLWFTIQKLCNNQNCKDFLMNEIGVLSAFHSHGNLEIDKTYYEKQHQLYTTTLAKTNMIPIIVEFMDNFNDKFKENKDKTSMVMEVKHSQVKEINEKYPKYLGIEGANISNAGTTFKIPKKQFDTLRQKYQDFKKKNNSTASNTISNANPGISAPTPQTSTASNTTVNSNTISNANPRVSAPATQTSTASNTTVNSNTISNANSTMVSSTPLSNTISNRQWDVPQVMSAASVKKVKQIAKQLLLANKPSEEPNSFIKHSYPCISLTLGEPLYMNIAALNAAEKAALCYEVGIERIHPAKTNSIAFKISPQRYMNQYELYSKQNDEELSPVVYQFMEQYSPLAKVQMTSPKVHHCVFRITAEQAKELASMTMQYELKTAFDHVTVSADAQNNHFLKINVTDYNNAFNKYINQKNRKASTQTNVNANSSVAVTTNISASASNNSNNSNTTQTDLPASPVNNVLPPLNEMSDDLIFKKPTGPSTKKRRTQQPSTSTSSSTAPTPQFLQPSFTPSTVRLPSNFLNFNSSSTNAAPNDSKQSESNKPGNKRKG